MIFDSLGRQLDMTELNIASATSAASELSKENLENEKFQNFSAEIPAESEHADEPKEAQAEAQQSDTAEPEEAKSSITRDDIVRLVTKKLKENRDINGPKIRKIINQHDAENLPQLTEENFEAVMTEIASL